MSLERSQCVLERRPQFARRTVQIERALRSAEELFDEEHSAGSDATLRVCKDGSDLKEEWKLVARSDPVERGRARQVPHVGSPDDLDERLGQRSPVLIRAELIRPPGKSRRRQRRCEQLGVSYSSGCEELATRTQAADRGKDFHAATVGPATSRPS
jgi:hypothetical protein